MPGIQDILSLLGNYGRDFGAAFDPENYDFELEEILRMLRGGGGRKEEQDFLRPPREEYANIGSVPSMTPDAPLPDQRRSVGSLTWLGPSSRRAAAGEEFPIYSSDSGGGTAERYRTGGTFNAPELTDERRKQGWGMSTRELMIEEALRGAISKGDFDSVARIEREARESAASDREAAQIELENADWERGELPPREQARQTAALELIRAQNEGRGGGLMNYGGIQALAAQRDGGGGPKVGATAPSAAGEFLPRGHGKIPPVTLDNGDLAYTEDGIMWTLASGSRPTPGQLEELRRMFAERYGGG